MTGFRSEQSDRPANRHLDPQRRRHRRAGEETIHRRSGIIGINDLDMIRGVAGHHLVAGDSVENCVHDGPLAGRCFETATCFGVGQGDHMAEAEVHAESIWSDEDAAPDDLAGLGHARAGRPTHREIHRGLAMAMGPGDAPDVMGGRCGAADFEDPDVIVGRAAGIMIAPA